MRTLGIDYGETRIGIAISDPMKLFAQGLDTLTPTGKKDLWRSFFAIFDEYSDIDQVVVGFPYNMDGTTGTMGEKVTEFIDQFKRRFPKIPVVCWDERLTSQAAERTMREANRKTKGRKHEIDKLAAIFILQSYLDAQR
ncbi:MAG: Holliday junction resolvase RuvX [Gemmatimonadetes bacterium]|nr:MAG: Holliday junction resolvase RuvX [Gemmatimonadota bacterium]